ncbi:unnamed protein product, partial [Ilex paraguariensis]
MYWAMSTRGRAETSVGQATTPVVRVTARTRKVALAVGMFDLGPNLSMVCRGMLHKAPHEVRGLLKVIVQ